MRSLLALTLSSLALTGCVTESSYNGSDKPVIENKINNESAARTRIALALQYLDTGNNSQAKYNLERAIEFAPMLPEVHYSLAYYYQQVGENERADKAYQKALEIKPDDPNTLNNYGVFLCGIKEYDRATDQFLKAIEIPSYIRVAESYENLALCAIEFNDFENAESYFKQAINHSSQRSSTLISLAALFYAKSDLHKAGEVLKRHDDIGRVSARALLLSYLIKQRMGRIEEAEKIAATIMQTYPTSKQAYAIRDNRTKQTEFEILREKYRKAQLEELQEQYGEEQVKVEQPKIKIVRKKRPTASTSLVTPTAKTPSPVLNETAKAKLNLAATTKLVTTPVTKKNVADKTPVQPQKNAPASVATVATVKNDEPEAANITATHVQPSQAKTNTAAKPAENLSAKTDTAAVLTALTTAHQSKPAPEAKPQQQVAKKPAVQTNDEVKIISFGAPKQANFNAPQGTQASASKPQNNGPNNNVVFYEATKNADVFAQNNTDTNAVKFKSYQTSAKTELPMLNPKVSPLQVPFHIIEFGENLFSISVRYNVKLQKLLQWNGLKESDRVINGSKIYLNDPNIYYEIKAGDTLYDIATQRHVLIDELMRWNKLSPDIALTPGHRLLLVDPNSYLL
ncbi:hypothetical protein PESP_b0277 [Pseudoalteromonas espejiana DSM 9414]|uniref:LysM domain-containing protein n=1 Tax=Pseudoalteromonas espejiana TaxID=28107 RepID=A0A510XUH3_9GAMM|nr:type IV pilus biogenesis/stability protein PilW [Pseudoalteromonas espejiana]ASM51863.1 hypothetical protein PESP_b0277 [Pseudoalteromonas espejiana DSM 9414]GEK54662.1 hypothetical protein PES01_15070 [Pseudoalteromonas espejiana]